MHKRIVFIILVLGVFALWFYARHPLVTTVTINGKTFAVDVAVTPREKETGLGLRDTLAADGGMLFVFDAKALHPFWMRNMRFPIDILWIDDKKIVDISRNVLPSDKPVSELPIYHPAAPVNLVLEIRAGLSDAYGFRIGDTIAIKN